MASRLQRTREGLQEQTSIVAGKARKSIQRKPLTAVGVATGAAVVVGAVAAAALSRNGKDKKRGEKKKKRSENTKTAGREQR